MNRLKAWSIFLLVLAFSVGVVAQTYEGRILGNVTDKSGGVVKDARVTITNVNTGATRTLMTNEAGNYVAPSLPPGVYKITVEATGFKKVERFGVRLEVAKDADIDFILTPGDITESIKVTEEAPMIETTNDTLGGTFANKAINDLPLNGRDFQNLVVLRPGVQRVPGGGFLSISSNGNRPEDNNFIVDGTDNNDPYYGTTVINAEGVQGTPGTILPIDAIQEFNAQENPPAEYGWKPGAIINLGLKSGTNDVHGTASAFERNSAFDARNYFNTVTDPNTGLFQKQKAVRQHQFGGSIGGPIVKNKTFIFGSYEGVRGFVSNSNSVVVPVTAGTSPTPTPPAPPTCGFITSGDCANNILDALRDLNARPGFTVPAGTCGGVPVMKNAGGTASLNPLSANLIGCGAFTGNGPYPGLLPANGGAGFTSIQTGFPNANRMDAFIIKMDHRVNDRHSLTGRYFFGDSLQQEQDIIVLRPEWRSQSQLRAQVFGVNYTWTASSRWVNELKFGYNRFWQSILTVDNDKSPITTFGINTGVTNSVNFGMPTILINGFTPIGGNSGWPLLTVPNETYQYTDNVSYTVGKHTLRFGAEYRFGKTDNLRNRRGKGRIRFQKGAKTFSKGSEGSGALSDSSPLEDFLAGNPDKGEIFVGNSERFVSILSFGSFFQDDWRVNAKLTINAGIRYDLNSSIRERNNQLGNFDPTVGLQQVGVNINSPYDISYKNFSPRLGIAWDPFGKSKTVIRAGGGITYEIPHLAIFLGQNGVNNATTPGLNVIPTGATGTNLAGNGGTIQAAATTIRPGGGLTWGTTGTVFPLATFAINCAATPCDILGVRRNLSTPYVATWNLNIQQALGNSTTVQVGYVGNRGIKLYSIRDINQVDPAKDDGSEQFGRPFTYNCPAPVGAGVGGPCFPFLGYVNFLENGYTSSYHGLQTSVTQRVWHGLTFVGGYTWSHAIDFVSLNRAQQPQNSLRPDLEKGDGDNDVRHRFTLALTFDLPAIKTRSQLLEGWQINSIVTIQTGVPYTAYDFGDDTSFTGEFSDRWNVVANPSTIPNFTVVPGAAIPVSKVLVAPPCDLTKPIVAGNCFGNGGRNTFRAPGFRNWDFSLVKTFRFNERASVQIRGEFFNVLNHPNFANPGSSFNALFNDDLSSTSSFGSVTATPDVAGANPIIGSGGQRNIQIGIKFRF